MPNPFVYVQLHTQNHEAAKGFYTRLLGWRLSDGSSGKHKYTEIDVGRGTAGGMMRATSPKVSSHWLPFVQVADVDKITGQAIELGAAIIVHPTNVPRKGRYSVISDPTGAAIALFTPIKLRRNGRAKAESKSRSVKQR